MLGGKRATAVFRDSGTYICCELWPLTSNRDPLFLFHTHEQADPERERESVDGPVGWMLGPRGGAVDRRPTDAWVFTHARSEGC